MLYTNGQNVKHFTKMKKKLEEHSVLSWVTLANYIKIYKKVEICTMRIFYVNIYDTD